jgi:uncharacterized protein
LEVNRYDKEQLENYFSDMMQILFEVTDSCNLDCAYCGYGDLYTDYDKREGKRLDIRYAKSLMNFIWEKKAKKANVNRFKYDYIGFYGGEPLMNFPFIKEMVDYVNENKQPGSGVKFSLTTNGALLERYMDYLVEKDFNVSISLDGDAGCNSYRTFKNGSPSFPSVFKNALKLQNRYPEFFKTNVSFVSVYHNLNPLDKMQPFFQEHFGKIPLIISLSRVGVNQEKVEEFRAMHKLMVDEVKPGEAGPENLYRHPWRVPFMDLLDANTFYSIKGYSKLRSENEDSYKVQTATCNPFENKLFLTVNGKILPCERIPQAYSLGTADENGIHIDYQEVADKFARWYGKISKKCNVCCSARDCQRCILQLDLECEDCDCSKFLNAEDRRKDLERSFSRIEDSPLLYGSIMKGVR